MIVYLLMRVPCVLVLFALAGCNGRPARLVAGIADTVVVNNWRPMQLPMHVFDAAGHVLPDTGVRFQWISGARVPVSSRGVVTCTHAGDTTLNASLGLAHPGARLGADQCGHLHRRRLGTLVGQRIRAREHCGGNPAGPGPGGAGASRRWRDARLAASAIAADLHGDDASRPGYAASASAGYGQRKL